MLNWEELNQTSSDLTQISVPLLSTKADDGTIYRMNIDLDETVSVPLEDKADLVKASIKIKHYDTGLAPGCNDCEPSFIDPDNLDFDPFYSVSLCEAPCHIGEHLAGNRYFAHIIFEDNNYEHLEVCVDCYEHLSDA